MSLGAIVMVALVVGVAFLAGSSSAVPEAEGRSADHLPETLTNEAVRVDAGHAAVSAMMATRADAVGLQPLA